MNSKLLKLARLVLKLSETKTDKGVLISDSELLEGVLVSVEDENGELIPAEDGEYLADDERVIVIKEGKVAEIREKDEPKEDEKPEEEVKVEEEEIEIIEEPKEEVDPRIAELEALVEDLKKQIEERDARIAELEKKQEEKVEMSKQTPAYKEVKVEESQTMSLAEAIRKTYNK